MSTWKEELNRRRVIPAKLSFARPFVGIAPIRIVNLLTYLDVPSGANANSKFGWEQLENLKRLSRTVFKGQAGEGLPLSSGGGFELCLL